jgi:hypothetical protein
MFGKKSSLVEIKKYLIQEKGITNICDTHFCQGKTMRWAIAWSFLDKDTFQLKKVDYFTNKDTTTNKIDFEIEKVSTLDEVFKLIKHLFIEQLKVDY